MDKNTVQFKTKEYILCSFFIAIISICSFIKVPLPFSAVPVTMQTFGVFCAGLCLNKKAASVSMIVYILIGAAGVPVFSGFTSGLGIIAGPTGGFIIGFVPAVFIIGYISEKFYKKVTKNIALILLFACTAGLLIVYFFGTLQFMHIANVNLAAALSMTVIPFILPDLFKIALAVFVYLRIHYYI